MVFVRLLVVRRDICAVMNVALCGTRLFDAYKSGDSGRLCARGLQPVRYEKSTRHFLWGAVKGSCGAETEKASRARGPGPHTHRRRRPSPSSKLAVLTVCELATSSAHLMNQAARLSEIPRCYVMWRSSNPTHVTLSPPAVLPQERSTPAVEQRMKNEIRVCWRFFQ